MKSLVCCGMNGKRDQQKNNDAPTDPRQTPNALLYRVPLVGLLAQLVEQLTLNQRVTGSSPVQPTKYFKDLS